MDDERCSSESDDSDFEDLEEPDTADVLDEPDLGGLCPRGSHSDHMAGEGPRLSEIDKVIPFSNIHKPRKGFNQSRRSCWMEEPITVEIIDHKREEHPHMTRKAFNPNLYIIKVTHGEYTWIVRRRYKHFQSLHNALNLFRAKCTLPVPTKEHRELRQSMKIERKERRKKKKNKKISRFPKKPEMLVKVEGLEKRKRHLEEYLQGIVDSRWYRNHSETLKFLEVSELSFINHLGQKWKEGDINKCSGGRRISIGCCGCLKKYHLAGRWSSRWLIVKDTFLAYVRPSDGVICDVMLMDSEFKVETGMSATGAPHGLLLKNLTRQLLAKCWTGRKAEEWEKNIKEAAESTGKMFIERNRFDSFAPKREKSFARWFVDGSSYFEAVADALEKAKEEIFITDWWLSPEIYMKRMVTDIERWRLDEILGRKAKAGVKVFVLLYKEMEIALTINSHYSKHALMSRCPENIKVMRHPDHVAGGNRVLLWAHHEKLVVIDQKTAFLGGLDICYGRWDDEYHRMTDLGSVQFSHGPTSTQGHQKIESVIPMQHRHKPGTKKASNPVRPPSTILESSESRAEEDDIEEGKETQAEPSKNMEGAMDQCIHGNVLPGSEESGSQLMPGQQQFGSSDVLTDNDSLEDVQKVGFTNVMAEVTVHHSGTPAVSGSGRQLGADDGNHGDGDGNLGTGVDNRVTGSKQCNNDVIDNEGAPDDKGREVSLQQIVVTDVTVEGQTPAQAKDSGLESHADSGDINIVDHLFDRVESQIRQNGNHLGETTSSAPNETDLNKNQTKANVHFRDTADGAITDDVIVPQKVETVEKAPPKPKKTDAASKRESWASRKIRKTWTQRFRGDKCDEEDGKPEDAGDKSDSDSDDGKGISARMRRKWRLVLDIKKLEHAGKQAHKPDSGDLVTQPDSPVHGRHVGFSPHPSLSTRIRQSMPFRHQRRDFDEDLYHDLYPWKGKGGKKDEVAPISIMKSTTPEPDIAGLEGSSKLWIGKDYVNFIHKDPVDVHNPFEDFIARDKTPRMPWHDIGGVVYGKAARDVARHFIGRWNFTKTEKFKSNKQFPLLMPKSYQKCSIPQAIKNITYEVNSQILRSACGWSAGIMLPERSILNAYIECINRAKHYIYIENQFFITQVGDHTMVKNEIADALLNRIVQAYKAKETFRVYVVLPLLPAFEGEIGENGGYCIQAVTHWNYQSISKGPNALWTHLLEKVDDPKKYLVFCGLRSHEELAGRLVTELVYVHSKMMIVDDDTVIIGSANINDRSMIGTRDSEMAVLVEDVHTFPVTMAGRPHQAGRYASSLRRTLFREHLGLGELELDPAINLSDPVSDDFYKKVWVERATINTTIYHKVFGCVPDDHMKTFADVKEASLSQHLAETDPQEAKEQLKKVRGRLVLLPLYFLDHLDSIIPVGLNREAVLPNKFWL